MVVVLVVLVVLVGFSMLIALSFPPDFFVFNEKCNKRQKIRKGTREREKAEAEAEEGERKRRRKRKNTNYLVHKPPFTSFYTN
jgi:hypothetical protein